MIQNCTYCDYEWELRVERPKACPRCKRRFDYCRVVQYFRPLEVEK